jgi:hypothetical protein
MEFFLFKYSYLFIQDHCVHEPDILFPLVVAVMIIIYSDKISQFHH